MRKPQTSEPGMFSTHPNPDVSDVDGDDAPYDYDYDDDADDADPDDAGAPYDSDADEDEADEEEEEEEVGDSPRSLHLACAYCGETNRLRPPKGYEFAQKEGEDGEVKQIRYRCTCGEINRFKVALPRESVA